MNAVMATGILEMEIEEADTLEVPMTADRQNNSDNYIEVQEWKRNAI